MIKQCIKNYFTNLKYIFIPILILALSILVAVAVLLPGIISSTDDMVVSVEDTFLSSSTKLSDFGNHFSTSIKNVDWTNPFTALSTVTDGDWLMQTIKDCLNATINEGEVDVGKLTSVTNNYADKLSSYAVVFFAIVFLGLVVGYAFTRWFIRRKIARRNVFKSVIALVANAIITSCLIGACTYFFALWKVSVFISSIVSVLVYGFIALFISYLIHGFKKIKASEIVNIKNVSYLVLSNLAILCITVAVISLIFLIDNMLVVVIAGIVLFEIALIVIDLNAESYVKNRVDSIENGTGKAQSEKKN